MNENGMCKIQIYTDGGQKPLTGGGRGAILNLLGGLRAAHFSCRGKESGFLKKLLKVLPKTEITSVW
ncbi:MAG: hypothetical protein IJ375_06450 [Oscillospiraceae bacterium]|nr:hypothetical protein [Oscillospiraceae bacterium]